MAITVRFPGVVALDGEVGGVQTPVLPAAVIRRNTAVGGAETFDFLTTTGPDVGLALLGSIDFDEIMSRGILGQRSKGWLVLRVVIVDRDATAAAAALDIGRDMSLAAGILPISQAVIAIGPVGTASLGRDNFALYQGDSLLVSEGAAGGPWDISVTVTALSTGLATDMPHRVIAGGISTA